MRDEFVMEPRAEKMRHHPRVGLAGVADREQAYINVSEAAWTLRLADQLKWQLDCACCIGAQVEHHTFLRFFATSRTFLKAGCQCNVRQEPIVKPSFVAVEDLVQRSAFFFDNFFEAHYKLLRLICITGQLFSLH